MAYSQEKKQEIFERVALHLRTQPRSVEVRKYVDCGKTFSSCMYRGPNNTKCAVGCLIPDSEYKTWFEGASLCSVLDNVEYLSDYDECKNGSYKLETDFDFIHDLQKIHDNSVYGSNLLGIDGYSFDSEALEIALETVAKKYGVRYVKT